MRCVDALALVGSWRKAQLLYAFVFDLSDRLVFELATSRIKVGFLADLSETFRNYMKPSKVIRFQGHNSVGKLKDNYIYIYIYIYNKII